MLLNERKRKILHAIVSDYIETAEPVGSRTLAKKYGFGLSSATIRNEMSDLFEMGLIAQPHTSSGRIPSDAGYRLYVDMLMEPRSLTASEATLLMQMMSGSIYQTEIVLREMARALAHLTNYPTIVSEPVFKKTKIKHVQLVSIDENSCLMILVTDQKTVRNRTVQLAAAPDAASLERLSALLTKTLQGQTFSEISNKVISDLLAEFGVHGHILVPILQAIADLIRQEPGTRVYISGTKNILGYPEFSDIRKATALLNALEDTEQILSMLGATPFEGIQVVIGAENTLELLKACSLVRACFCIDEAHTGQIALIGPVRMDYETAVSVVYGFLERVELESRN